VSLMLQKGEVRKMRDAETILGIIRKSGLRHWRAGSIDKVDVRFGGGPLEKGYSGGTSPAAYPVTHC